MKTKRSGWAAALAIAVFLTCCAARAQAAARTFLDFQSDPPTSAAQTPPGWNYYTIGDSLVDRQIPLSNEFGVSEGLSFQYYRPESDRSATFTNTAVPAAYAPTGIDLSGFGYSMGFGGMGQKMVLSGLVPQAEYDFWFLGWTYSGEPYPAPATLSVTGVSDWTEITTPAGALLAINGVPTDTAHTFDSYARRFTAGAEGTLTIATAQTGYVGVFGFMIQPVPEPNVATAIAALLFARSVGRRRID